jgi:molybdate transport system substrate-binding protein
MGTSRWSCVVVLVLLAVAGCERNEPGATPDKQLPEKELVVFAASSLREVFTALGDELGRAHPESKITFNFAGSQELRTQIEQGARADVFASADTKHIEALVQAGKAASPILFARNEPVIAVSKESAGKVHGLADLPNLERIVVGTPEVPIGRYTLQILDLASASLGADFRARVDAKVVSRELNVRQVLAKVTLGEAQAGFVYRTDARAAGAGVSVVDIPANLNVIAEYPISIVATPQPLLAKEFVSLVLSPQGQKILADAGFLPPSSHAAAP